MPNLPVMICCEDHELDVYAAHIQPRKHVLCLKDHAGYTAPTWQRQLDDTDQGCICPAWQM